MFSYSYVTIMCDIMKWKDTNNADCFPVHKIKIVYELVSCDKILSYLCSYFLYCIIKCIAKVLKREETRYII